MKIFERVHLVDGTNANVYLVLHDGKVALIDTGLPGEYEKTLRYLDGLGFAPEDVDLIVLTHSHHDHAGSLVDLKEMTGAKVAAHRDEIPYLTEKVLKWSGKRIDVEVPLDDGDEVAGLRVVHSPGHTPGSIVLYSGDLRAMFTGDLVYEEGGRLYEIPHRYSLDPERNREAIRNVLRLDFKHILPSHGRPILNEGKERWRELVEELGLEGEGK